MDDFLKWMTEGFMPHGFCLHWDPALLWTLIVANIGIAIAYFSIPAALLYFVRNKKDLPYPWIFRLFGMFIVACGLTHVMKTVTLFQPLYWPEALMDGITAAVSLLTAVVLWPLIPKALSLRGPAELEAINKKLSEEMLSGYRLVSIVEFSQDGIISTTLDGIITSWNNGAQVLFGYTPEEAIGKPVSMLYLPEMQESEPTSLDKLGRGEQIDHYETVRRGKDGKKIDVSITMSPLKSHDGKIIGASKIIRDITSRKLAEEALRASEQRARSIVENSYDPFVTIDARGTIIEWNSKAEATFGWTRQEVIGTALSHTIVPEKYRQNHVMGLQRFAETGSGPVLNTRIEITAIHRDGHEFPVELAIFPVHDAETYYFCAFVRDISERKESDDRMAKLTDDLLRSNIELQQFAYIAAHDLREPLRTIIGFTSLLKDETQGKLSDDAQENMGFIIDAGKRMQQLISDLLTYSRVETQAKPFVPTSTEKVLKETVANLKANLEEVNGKVTNDALPVVQADESQLSQVFLNLIANAVKFRSEEAPHIHVSAREEGDDWIFSFKDNGIGIDNKYSARVFQMFQRLHAAGEYAGTGIGLAVCKRIIERHGGRIWLESELGKGTTFFFSIPIRGKQPHLVISQS